MRSSFVLSFIALNAFIAKSEVVQGSEYGSYVNPNPRAYDRCDNEDLIKLSTCATDVLSKLDDCKPDDLACECCALQSMKQECYGLCSGNPSGNFLAVLYNDCESLNDVNACGLPFKKDDTGKAKVSRVSEKSHDSDVEEDQKVSKSKVKAELNEAAIHDSIVVKSTIQTPDQFKNSHVHNYHQDYEGIEDSLEPAAPTNKNVSDKEKIGSYNNDVNNSSSGLFNSTAFNQSTIFNSTSCDSSKSAAAEQIGLSSSPYFFIPIVVCTLAIVFQLSD